MTATCQAVVRFTLAAICGLVLGCALLHAQPSAAADRADWPALADPVFRVVGESSITTATAIVEDADGFLWAGGQGGLFRWDGYRLKTYEPDPPVAQTLPDAFIRVLLTDHRGHLWIGTMSGGLARYAPDRDAFITYAGDPGGTAGPSANTISALVDAGDGLWIGTPNGLDFRVDRTGVFRHYRHIAHDAGSLPNNVINAVMLDRSGALWVATDGGLVRRERGTVRFRAIRLRSADGTAPIALSLIEDSRQRVWIGTRLHGLFVVDAERGPAHPVHVNASLQLRALLQNDTIRSIGEPRPGQLWLGTNDYGILALDTASDQLSWIRNDPNLPTSLPQNTVEAVYRDRAGLVWVGTLGGLSRYDAEQRTFTTIPAASRALSGISSPDVNAVYAPASGPLWVGYGSDGIDVLDGLRGRVGAIRPDVAAPRTALPQTAVEALVGVPNGPVFIGSDRGLYRAEPNRLTVRLIPLLGQGERDKIGSLCVTGGRLWVGTEAEGVWSLDVAGRSPPARLRARLTDNRILPIVPAPGGRLWIGTYRGLNLVDPRSGASEHILADAADPSRLANGFISALMVDRIGRVWVGSYGGGLAVMQGRGPDGRPRFQRLGTAQGLPNANIDSLVADRFGRVWVATDNGLAVVDEATLTVRRFDRADGVEFTGYYLGSAATLPNGDIAFGANRGLTVVHPDRLRDWTYRPPLVVTEARAGGHVIAADGFNRRDPASPLIIGADANSLAVEFAALDYSAPEQNRYAYRLTGFDAGWTETDASHRIAAYTNLPPGNYALELRGSNRDGAWSAASLSIPVRVEPAWHQTLGFHLAEAVLAMFLVAALVQARTAVARRNERELERQVAQRTAELERTTDELREREHQLHIIAYRDALTDLPNRRMFTDECRRMVAAARRQGDDVAFLLIDLDRFKQINDTLGHDAGDALLIEAASRLTKCVRETDCVARLGGDEFVILLGAAPDLAAVVDVCERIVAAFVAPVAFGNATMRTTPSIGVAVFPKDGETTDQLYKAADLALYAAKLAGRNTWRYATLERT